MNSKRKYAQISKKNSLSDGSPKQEGKFDTLVCKKIAPMCKKNAPLCKKNAPPRFGVFKRSACLDLI